MDRAHVPVEINEFNGLWRRGSPRNTPPGYATDCDNIKILEDGIAPRPGVQPFQNLANPLGNVLRQYDYILPTGSTYLTLIEGGEIYHVTGPTTVLGPILTIVGMTDFGFQQNGSNAFISPGYTDANGHETGMPNEKIYVYKGDGTAARTAGGAAPTNNLKPFVAYPFGTDGIVTIGAHVVAVAYVNAGVDGAIGFEAFQAIISEGNQQIQLSNIPIGPVGTTDRIILMTRAVPLTNYDPLNPGTFYEVTRINDNTTESYVINVDDATLTLVYVPGATPAPDPNAMYAIQSATAGFSDQGLRVIGVVYETDTGAFTRIGPEFFAITTIVDVKKAVGIDNIPVSPNSYVVRRHLVATKVIRNFNGDQAGYQFFFIPNGTINDNTTTSAFISWFDAELLEDANYLLYNLATIPAGIVLSKYKDRLVSIAESGNMTLARLSEIGDPESFSELDGFILVTPNNKPLTNAQEFRDVLYLFQDTKTIAYIDNENAPATWEDTILDNGVGTANHAIATVLDSGGINVDFLLIGHYSGIFIFNGSYSRPELTFAINDLWTAQVRGDFYKIQIINDSVNKIIYCVMTDGNILVGDYASGLTPKDIKWSIWRFDFKVRTIHLTNVDTLVIGAFEAA